MSVFWWVELDLFPLEYIEVSSSEFWGVCEFGMALMFSGVFPFCWRISMVCLLLVLVGSWVDLVSKWVWKLLGELFSINVPWSQELSDALKFWS